VNYYTSALFPTLVPTSKKILGSNSETHVRFILVSTSLPEVIYLRQTLGQEKVDAVMYLTRTWAFAIHRQKMKMLGRWPEGRTVKKASYQNDPLCQGV
jgi:hypothetical protein